MTTTEKRQKTIIYARQFKTGKIKDPLITYTKTWGKKYGVLLDDMVYICSMLDGADDRKVFIRMRGKKVTIKTLWDWLKNEVYKRTGKEITLKLDTFETFVTKYRRYEKKVFSGEIDPHKDIEKAIRMNKRYSSKYKLFIPKKDRNNKWI
jgi:hypothetical protein